MVKCGKMIFVLTIVTALLLGCFSSIGGISNKQSETNLKGDAVCDNNIHLVWQDDRDGNLEIYYKKGVVSMPADDWPMFHHDTRNTGYSPSTAPDVANVLWQYRSNDIAFYSPVVTNGKVIVCSYNATYDGQTWTYVGNVSCLNATTGTLIWVYSIDSRFVRCAPAIVNGKVFVGSYDNYNIYCLDEATGALIWNYTTGNLIESSPVVANGKVFVSSATEFTCLNETTGALIWKNTTGIYQYSSPAVANGKVFVGASWDVLCFDENTGALVWSYNTGSQVMSSPAVVNGKVFVGSGNDIYCLNETTGAFVWNYTTGATVLSSPTVAYGKVFVSSCDKNIYCLDEATGALIWSYSTTESIESSPAVADGKVFFGSDKFYCLNESSGALIWDYQIGGITTASPAIAYGNVFISSGNGTVYCFAPIVTAVDEWPLWQHDAQNTGYSSDTILYPPLAQLWEYDTGYYIAAPPVASNEAVYAVRQDGIVYKLDADNGSKIWDKNVSYYVDSSPALGEGLVFVSLSNGTIYALNETTNNTIWSSTFGAGWQSISSVTYLNGIVYAGSADYNIYAIYASNGTEKWRFATESWAPYPPAIFGGVVYAGSSDKRLYAIYSANGTEKWRFPAVGNLIYYVYSPAVANGIVYAPAEKTYAIDANTGIELWNVTSGNLALGYGNLYVASTAPPGNPGMVYAFNATSGIQLWNYSVAGYEGALHIIIPNNVVYAVFGTEPQNSTIVALDAFSGSLLWQYNASSFLHPIIANGKLYASSSNGKVYCFVPTANLSDLTLTTADISFYPSNPVVGEEIYINITIHNIGNTTSPLLSIGLWVEVYNATTNAFIQTVVISYIPSIPAGSVGNINATMGVWSVADTYTIKVILDPNNVIPELNETNNEASKNMTVGYPAVNQLPVPIIQVYQGINVTDGDNVSITLRVAGAQGVVNMTVYKDGTDVSTVTVIRTPGPPQQNTTQVQINISKTYSIFVERFSQQVGASSVWVIVEYMGITHNTHRVFNAPPGQRQNETLNLTEILELMLNSAGLVKFDGSSSYDPDGWIANWSWDFGDGNFGYGAIVYHNYTDGLYTVTLTVTDNLGASNSTTAGINVTTLGNESSPRLFGIVGGYIETNNLIDILLLSPADATITDEFDRLLGYNKTSEAFENWIPNASFILYRDVEAYFAPNDLIYSSNVVGAGSGLYWFRAISPESLYDIKTSVTQVTSDNLKLAKDWATINFSSNENKKYTLYITKEDNIFTLTNMSIKSGEIHSYTVKDWENLASTKIKAVTLNIDRDGDGIVDVSVDLHSGMTGEDVEKLLEKPVVISLWQIIAVILVILLIAIAVLVSGARRKRAKKLRKNKNRGKEPLTKL